MAHHRDDAWGQLDQSYPFLPARRRAGEKIGGDGVDGEVAMTGRQCLLWIRPQPLLKVHEGICGGDLVQGKRRLSVLLAMTA